MYYVYFLSNKNKEAVYIGLTDNLKQFVFKLRNDLVEGFVKEKKLYNLVYFETFAFKEEAEERYKNLKVLNPNLKRALINGKNRKWEDISNSL